MATPVSTQILKPIPIKANSPLKPVLPPSSDSPIKAEALPQSVNKEKNSLQIVISNSSAFRSPPVIVQNILRTVLANVEEIAIHKTSKHFTYSDHAQWNQLEACLSQAKKINQTKAVPEDLSKKIALIINPILKKNNPDELLRLLKVLINLNYFETKKYFGQILTLLKQHYPILENYLKNKEGQQIVLPKGIKLLLEIFEDMYGWAKGQIQVHDVATIDTRIQEIRDSDETNVMQGWILYYSKTDHVVPVFVKKEGMELKFCIVDSKGISTEAYWLEPLRETLHGEHEKAYAYRSLRQRDGFSCPTFCILDLRNLIEGDNAGRDIFDFIERDIPKDTIKDISLPQSSSKIVSFDLLPPDMMKVTQSMKQLDQYRASTPEMLARAMTPVFERRSPTNDLVFLMSTPKVVFETVDRNVYCDPDGSPLNKYVEKKYFTYMTRLIFKLIDKKDNYLEEKKFRAIKNQILGSQGKSPSPLS